MSTVTKPRRIRRPGQRQRPLNPYVTEFPDLMSQWHPELNAGLDPATTTTGCQTKIWWLCQDCGHEWEALIHRRLVLRSGCRVCASAASNTAQAKPDPGMSFRDVYPEEAATWDYEKNDTSPAEHNHGANFKAWFICPTGHPSYQKSIAHRGARRSGCTKCSLPGVSRWELEVTQLLIDAGAHVQYPARNIPVPGRKQPLRPDIVIADDMVVIECDGFVWHEGKDALDARKSKLMQELGWTVVRVRAGLAPTSVIDVVVDRSPSAQDTVDALIPRLTEIGVRFDTEPTDRQNVEFRSPPANTRRVPYDESFAAVNPHLMVEWDYERNLVDPREVSPKSAVRVFWKCSKCRAGWETHLFARSPTLWCRACTVSYVDPRDSIAAVRPDMALDWSSENAKLASEVKPRDAAFKAKWRCHACGHKHETTPAEKNLAAALCRPCARRAGPRVRPPRPGRSVAERAPHLVHEWADSNVLAPHEVSAASEYKAKWNCDACGEEYELAVVKRISAGTIHPPCGRKRGHQASQETKRAKAEKAAAAN